MPVKNLTIEGYGNITQGVFLNEERLFGICKPKKKVEDETISSKSSKASSGKRSRA